MSGPSLLLFGGNQESMTLTTHRRPHPHGDRPPWTPPSLSTLTIVNVMRSISCLSLVLCCRKGLCLGKKHKVRG